MAQNVLTYSILMTDLKERTETDFCFLSDRNKVKPDLSQAVLIFLQGKRSFIFS